MALIQSRNEYNITQNAVSLLVRLKIYVAGTTAPTEWQYTITKNSYKDTTPEDLKINIAPFIRDFFDFSSGNLGSGEILTVVTEVNGTESTHTAYYSYMPKGTATMYNTENGLYKNLLTDHNQNHFIPYFTTSTIRVRYYKDDGSFIESNIQPSAAGLAYINTHTAPFLPNQKTLRVEIGDTKPVNYYYNLVCAYDKPVTIKFINQYGVWENITFIGSIIDNLNIETNEYRRFDNKSLQTFNTNGAYDITLNTGWIPEISWEMIEALMLSDYIQMDGITLILKSKNQKIQTIRNDKMINYTFTFDIGKNIIG